MGAVEDIRSDLSLAESGYVQFGSSTAEPDLLGIAARDFKRASQSHC